MDFGQFRPDAPLNDRVAYVMGLEPKHGGALQTGALQTTAVGPPLGNFMELATSMWPGNDERGALQAIVSKTVSCNRGMHASACACKHACSGSPARMHARLRACAHGPMPCRMAKPGP